MARERKVFESDNKRRLERMKRWLDRAKLADKDSHLKGRDKSAVRFIFYWIAFEAAFETQKRSDGKKLMERFIKTAVGKDEKKFDKLFQRKEVYQNSLVLLNLRGTHEWFWQKPKSLKVKTHREWRQLFDKEIKEFPKQNSCDRLCVVFNRLRVVRHQIFHGASSIEMSMGKEQVDAGFKVLSIVIPAFREAIEDSKGDTDWKPVPFPRVAKNSPPLW